MWFEIINTFIAAAGLGLASVPFFRNAVGFESPNPHQLALNFQWLTLNLRNDKGRNYARNGGLS